MKPNRLSKTVQKQAKKMIPIPPKFPLKPKPAARPNIGPNQANNINDIDMLALVKAVLAKSTEVQEIQLSVSSFYQLLTELPELPEATGVIVIDNIPIVMKTRLKQRKILIILKTKTL